MQYLTSDQVKGYAIQKKIGAGGFGDVYLAVETRPNFEREVALKVISPVYANEPRFIQRFESEARMIARLEYPYIVPLYDYWRDPNGAYLVMRWLKGGSVKDLLGKGPLDVTTAARIMNQVCSALALAHKNGVIHRDIKPGNILLDDEGNAFLGDFGIAKDFMKFDSNTQPEDIIGSPQYISPEQARSEAVTPRTDVYSLGVTLYEMLAGEHPFPDANMYETIYKHLNESLPLLASLDDAVQDDINVVIQKATAKNPIHRYDDALSFARAFQEAARIDEFTQAETVEGQLTIREQQILSLVVQGKTNKEIASELYLALDTVKWHLRNAYKKLGVVRREQAIVVARNLTLVGDDATFTLDDASRYLFDFEAENPYKGLESFTYADAGNFFGRGNLVDKLLVRLQQDHPHRRFLTVLGPSGSGKSSLVMAGLVPALWEGRIPGSEKWLVADMIPHEHPVDELEIALRSIAAKHADGLSEMLAHNERGLVKAAQLILPEGDNELLLIIDQFEEVFTLVESEQERVQFLNLIASAVTDPASRVRVVITIRADYYDRPLYYSQFGDILRDRVETVLPLSAKELQAAIVQPARKVGIKFEDGLVATIISDINYQPGSLPLLQYALTEMFDQRDGRTITREVYEKIGGAAGAIASTAEALFLGYDEIGHETIRQMFLRLVTLGEGAEDTRRRTGCDELLSIASDPDLMDEIIDTFAYARMLSLDNDPTTREPTVEVAHEAILREWEQLRGWLNDSRDDIKTQRQLSTLSAEWELHQRSTDYLVRGSRLDQLQLWSEATSLTLTPSEQAFLDASIAERERRVTKEKAQAEREAKLQVRARRVLEGLVAVFIIATVIATVLALAASNARADAEDERDRAAAAEQEAEIERDNAQRSADEFRSVALASGAQEQRLNGRPQVALALVLEAINVDDPPLAARRVFFEIASTSWMRHQYFGSQIGLVDGKFLADGKRFITRSRDGEIKVWEIDSGNVIHSYQPETGGLGVIELHPTRSLVVVGGYSQGLLLWDLETEEKEFLNFGLDATFNPLIFTENGTQLIAGGTNGQLFIIDTESRELLRTIDSHEPDLPLPPTAGDFSPDGKLLVTAGGLDQTARVFDTTTWEQLAIFEDTSSFVLFDAQFLPDGKRIILGGSGNIISLWDWEADEVIWAVDNGSSVQDIVLTPDNKYFVTGNNPPYTHVSLWELETGELVRTYEGHRDRVQNVDISPDGSRILSISQDGTAVIWDTWDHSTQYIIPVPSVNVDVDGDNVVAFDADTTRFVYQNTITHDIEIREIATGDLLQSFALGYPISNAAFNPDGHSVLVFDEQGLNQSSRLDLQTGEIMEWEPPNNIILSWGFSPDGTLFASQQLNSGTYVQDVETGEILYQLEEGGGKVFSRDGELLYGATRDRLIGVWNVASGELVRTFAEGDIFNVPADISADGKTLLTLADDVVNIWDIETGELLHSLNGHTSFVYTAEFNPDETMILTAGEDKTLILWDAATGESIRRYVGHSTPAFAQFNGDGSMIISYGEGGEIIAWNVDIPENGLKAWVKENRFIPDFTCEQRDLYQIEPLCE